MTVLFFMWGFMTVFNDILIPRFKEAFTLDYFQAMLVQFAFFGAYFIGSLIYYLISVSRRRSHCANRLQKRRRHRLADFGGGQRAVLAGGDDHFLSVVSRALFVVGLGFAMLQIAANPYVTILGPERTASRRLNLAQAFNSVGTTTGPLIGGYLIFQYFAKTGAHGAESVKIPYLMFCIVFVMLAVVFFFIHLPHVGEGKIEPGVGALKYPHVVLGVLAIFMYVGGEVSVGSAIINFLGQPNVAGHDAHGGQQIRLAFLGRHVDRPLHGRGGIERNEKNQQATCCSSAIPVLGFLLFWILRSWNSDRHQFDFAGGWAIVKNYLPLLALCWLLFQFGKALAGRTL